MEVEPVEMQNAKISTAFSNGDEYLANERYLLNLYDMEVYFFKISSILSKIFFKKNISILSIYLLHLGDALDK